MASAFWGGFAGTLLKERQADDAADREIDSYKKKQEILREMERREEPDVDQKVFHIFDGNGKEIGTRPMTPYQLKEYARKEEEGDLTIREKKAKVGSAEQQFSLDTEFARSERVRAGEAQEASIESSRASAASSRNSISTSNRRLSLDEARESRSAEIDNLNLSAAREAKGPATVAAVQAKALPQLETILQHGGNLAMNDFRNSVKQVLDTNPSLKADQAAQIVVSAMQKRYGAKAAAIANAAKKDAGGL